MRHRVGLVWSTLRLLAIGGATLFVLLTAGLVWFATASPAANETAATDAIVVLTGGSLRLHSGLALLTEGKGRKLFVSGVNHQVDLDDLLRSSGVGTEWTRDRASCCVVLGHHADDTLGNARETAQWMRQQGFRSLRLVTAWYHMPRSLLEFRRAMPEIDIVANPVFPDQARQEYWWTRRGTTMLLVSEYSKYLAALLSPLVERLQSDGPGTVPDAGRRAGVD